MMLTYLRSFLSSRNDVWTDAASSWYQTLTDASNAGANNVPTFTQLAETYPVAKFAFPYEAMVTGLLPALPPEVSLNLGGAMKRQAACPFLTTATIGSSGAPALSSGIVSSVVSSTLSSSAAVSTVPFSSAISFSTIVSSTPPSTVPFSSAVSFSTIPSSTTPSGVSASATPTGNVYINIYVESDCTNLIEETQLNLIGECYSPKDADGNPIEFGCFRVVYASSFAIDSSFLSAFKGDGCFFSDQIDYDFGEIQGVDESPFTMGSLSLGYKRVAKPANG